MKSPVKRVLLCFVSLLYIICSTGCELGSTHTGEVIFDEQLYTLVGDTYVRTISNNLETAEINQGITIPNNTKIGFYLDEDYQFSFLCNEDDMIEGNNFYYGLVTYKDNSTFKFKINIYRLSLVKVKFKTFCSQNIDDLVVEENTVIEAPDVQLERAGYTFKGWKYNFKNAVTQDMVIEAKWSANNYTVSIDPNGGEYYDDAFEVTYNEEFDFGIPTKEGYEFVGWKYNDELIKSNKWLIDNDVTVVAEWERAEVTYEIEYVIVGAIGPNLDHTYSNKKTLVLKTPYKCGYQFIGWYYEGDFSGERVFEIPAGTEGDLRLYSRWKKFNLEGAKVSILGDSISTFYDSSSEINSNWNGKNEYYYPLYNKEIKAYTDTWWGKFLVDTKSILETNESKSGSSCYNWGNESNPSAAMNLSRINKLGKPDIVIIFIGVNDNVNGFTNEQFSQAYQKMLERVKEQCTDAFVFCCTMGYSAYTGYNYTEERRLAFNDIIRKEATNYDATVIEIANIQTENNYQKYLGDFLHPNLVGMEAYAQEVIKVIREHTGNL